MAPKRKTSAGDASTTKRQKKVMSLSQKVMLLDRLLRGETAASVSRHYGINESTVRYIWKNAKVICDSISVSERCIEYEGGDPFRDVHIERMEKAPSIWIKDKLQKSMPLSCGIVKDM
uniref:putative CENPB DNA-binding domain-containing protein 1 n=1 Tax=Myxine glutinosa TaxID=7769 RepID=UPI00358EE646